MEIGSPMASMYILDFPDHYTNFKFINMYWKIYIHAIDCELQVLGDNSLLRDPEVIPDEKVMVQNQYDKIVPVSKLDDYCHRGQELQDFSVYDFVLRTVKKKLKKNEVLKFLTDTNCNIPKIGGGSSETETDTLTEDSLYSDSDTAVSSEDISNDGDTRKNKRTENRKIIPTRKTETKRDDSGEDTPTDFMSQTVKANFIAFEQGHPQQDSHYLTLY